LPNTVPLGHDPSHGFQKLFPPTTTEIQLLKRVTFGNPRLRHNRLIRGDNLNVMRQLPSASIDLIYIDPPFFSGRNYRIDGNSRNDTRSFRDVWEGGLSHYLIWLNARLEEIRRLLKPTGCVYVHCDWHASHYIKVEMDKIFGYEHFVNEVIWSYKSGGGSTHHFGRKHDTLLLYAKSGKYRFYPNAVRVPYDAIIADCRRDMFNKNGKVSPDVWNISRPPNHSKEWLGYPTQKPAAVIEMAIKSVTRRGDLVADFFCGSGTTPAVAQQLGRRWIACDQSAAAIKLTATRIRSLSTSKPASRPAVPDCTLERCVTRR